MSKATTSFCTVLAAILLAAFRLASYPCTAAESPSSSQATPSPSSSRATPSASQSQPYSSPSPPAPLSGRETSKIVAEIYNRLGPRLGSYFVEANIVLTLAGARGFTEFFVAYPRPGDDKVLQSLNTMLAPRGLRIGKGIPLPGCSCMMVGIESLHGFERISRLTGFSVYTPFEASSGWEALKSWNAQVFKRAQEQGLKIDDIQDISSGIRYGYPDIAIKDFLEWRASSRKIPMVDSDIPFVKRYQCAEPNFSLKPEHRDDPDVKATVSLFGTILKDFYGSPWHRERESDPIFLAARKANDDAHEQMLEERAKNAAIKNIPAASERTGAKSARFYGLRLAPGCDLYQEIEKFAKERSIISGFVATCCGSLTAASIRYAGMEKPSKLEGRFEIVSLGGTISSSGGSHLHISLSDSQGRTVGGHLMEGSRVYTTAEIIIGSLDGVEFTRIMDTRSGCPELRFLEK
ncbi:MAG: DNA-binding protein [Candidatus Eremiobacteraeota bacterium]|nr:DNA-binding protein [Candidatus Eremiobacteraeota bacterium]